MGGGNKWRKLKLALGMNTCLYVPKTLEDTSPSSAGLLPPTAPAPARSSDCRMPLTPTPSSSGLQISRHGIKSSKGTCAICLTSMKTGNGHAIFTAECSHSFHFHCITSNVKHGNQICPVCRSKWKEVPFKNPASDPSRARSRINRGSWPLQDNAWMVLQGLPPQRVDGNRNVSPSPQTPEPSVFDDDEPLNPKSRVSVESGTSSGKDFANDSNDHSTLELQVKTYPENSAISRTASHNNFAILLHLKAPVPSGGKGSNRAPVDLLTVLDVSGSMAGTKLALLKQAMGFVIQNLGPSDRLSVIAFSSTAKRLFPLRLMTNNGKQEALQAINSLVSNGGTNIAEALKKGAKVMTERKCKNPVSSIILLSDGQDTYTLASPRRAATPRLPNYQTLLPSSMLLNNSTPTSLHIPVHTFGFGADHDATAMHSISEASGGTFSFIEAENVIQDAFAQCIGGILSVVAQELRVEVECVHPQLKLGSIKAGSYKSGMESGLRGGFIAVGDLYAEEERDFLVTMDVPPVNDIEMHLMKVRCVYKDPISKEVVTMERNNDIVTISRPETASGHLVASIEVDRQRNRLKAAEAISEARVAAEHGNLTGAVSELENCRKQLSGSVSAQAGDRLCIALVAELREMQERMANRRVYETSGRAYVLSGLSSHSLQRATARGDSTETTSIIQTYQTPSMVDMVNLSQTMCFGSPPAAAQRSLRASQSFPAWVQPR